MNNSKKIVLLTTALILASMACSTFSGGGTSDAATGILYQDDFSNTSSGWGVGTDEYGITDYYQSGFRIKTEPTNWILWSGPGEQYSDAQVVVDATKLGGPDTNDYGIICRYQDASNFYALTIGSDGYAGIWMMQNDSDALLVDEYVFTDFINQGEATNNIQADCVGNTLTLYVNGNQVLQTTDTTFSSGDVALLVGTFDEGQADILFDNFIVYDPSVIR